MKMQADVNNLEAQYNVLEYRLNEAEEKIELLMGTISALASGDKKRVNQLRIVREDKVTAVKVTKAKRK
jgi:hypothetical protein